MFENLKKFSPDGGGNDPTPENCTHDCGSCPSGGSFFSRDLGDLSPAFAQRGKKAYFDHRNTSFANQKGRGGQPLPCKHYSYFPTHSSRPSFLRVSSVGKALTQPRAA